MSGTQAGSCSVQAVIALCLAITLSACSTVAGLWTEGGGGARRADQAFLSGRYDEAEQLWTSALQAAEHQGRDADVAELRLKLARLYEARGDYESAERSAAEVAAYASSKGYRELEARALNSIALVLGNVGLHAESSAAAQEAYRLAEETGARAVQAESLMYIGAADQQKGQLDAADHAYRKGLALARTAGDPLTEAALYNGLGYLYRFRAEYQKARDAYGQSLRLREQLGDVRGRGKVLGNLCILHQNLNDLRTALGLCEESLAVAQKIQDRKLEANNLNNLGGLYRTLGEYPQALAAYNRALRIKQDLNDRNGQARAWSNLGDLYRRQGDTAAAIGYLRKSMRLAEASHDRSGQSAAYYLLGLSYLDTQRYADACAAFGEALGLQAAIGQPELLWRDFDGLSRCWQGRSKPTLAIFFGKQAVNTIQGVRTNIHTMDPALQRDFLRDKNDVYRRLADLLIDQGRILEAQHVLAMLKEEEYFDFLRRGTEHDSPRMILASNKLEASELDQYNEIRSKLVKIGLEYAALWSKATRSAAEETHLAELQSQLDEARRVHNLFLSELQSAFDSAGRGVEFGKKDLEDLQQLAGQLKELGRRVLLAHYLVLEDRIRIILTPSDPAVPPLHQDVALSRTELNRLIHEARTKLGNRNNDPRPALRELYLRLIAPIDEDLRAYGPEVLMLSLDQALRYVPYSALHDGAHYLVERYPLAIYNLAAKGSLNKPSQEWQVAGFGVSKGFEGFPPLQNVIDELDAIVLEGGTDHKGAMPGKSYVNDAFTEKQFRDVLRRGGYAVIHMATHFHFEPGGNDTQSYLLLGSGEHLTLQQVNDRGYLFSGVNLLTFSACQTGVGNEGDPHAGTEVESFGNLAQQKGAQAVMATLWEISDPSTAVFMPSFYRHRAHRGTTKAEALRQTQLDFIRGKNGRHGAAAPESRGQVLEASTNGGKVTPPNGDSYAHPYEWAPFVLMGNWL